MNFVSLPSLVPFPVQIHAEAKVTPVGAPTNYRRPCVDVKTRCNVDQNRHEEAQNSCAKVEALGGHVVSFE